MPVEIWTTVKKASKTDRETAISRLIGLCGFDFVAGQSRPTKDCGEEDETMREREREAKKKKKRADQG
jgi:hypothetical protein